MTRIARPLLLLLGVYALAALSLPALRDIPLNDDWAYGPTAAAFARTPWTVANLAVQALWGRLFLSLFGHGFAALRASTLAASLLGAAAFWSFLRRERLAEGVQTPLTAALLFSPLWFVLSASFMTDVPCAALVVAAAAAAASERLWQGALLCGLAVGVRQTALAVPAAWLALLAWERKLKVRSAAAIAGPSALVYALCLWWRAETPSVPHPLETSPLVLLGRAATGLYYAGLFALPAAAGFWADAPLARLRALPRSRQIALLVFGIAFAAGTFWLGAGLPPNGQIFYDCNYLTEKGLGCWDLQGVPSALASPLFWSAASLACAAGLTAALSPRHPRPVLRFSLLCAVASFSALPAQRFFDRYFLSLAPAALCLAAPAVGKTARARAALWAAAAGVALFSWAGTADYLRAEEAAWTLGERAVARGLPPESVHASRAWCWSREWPRRFEESLRAGKPPEVDQPSVCMTDPEAVVTMKEKLRVPLPLVDSEEYFSPLRSRRIVLRLYKRR